MELDFASAWEAVTDTVPGATAIVQGDRRLTYAAYDDISARFATALESAGVEAGASVALYLYNCPEYLIAQYGAFKHRAVSVNVNYRYLDDELAYLLENSEAQALVFHSSLGERVAKIRDRLGGIKLLVEVDDDGTHLDGSMSFDAIGDYEPQARQERSGDDLYMLYTGGTTGMPKGVMYHQGPFVGGLYGGFLSVAPDLVPPSEIEQIGPFIAQLHERGPAVSIPCCPLMHGTGMWVSAFFAFLGGGAVVLLEGRSFDADEVWRLVEREGVTEIVIVGDPFARPLLRALERREADGRPYDTSSVQLMASSGAIWSAEIKDGLRARLDARFMDLLGSTEGGTIGLSVATSGAGAKTAKFLPAPGTRVITAANRDVVPGSGEQGVLASETYAFGYFKDEAKTAQTFLELDGHWYVLTGDWATVEVDGTITLLGRGSICINSGGEKIYVEEVEEAIKRYPGIDDCLVVGLPDERFGQRVVAVASSTSNEPPSSADIQTWLRDSLAHYKIPKSITVLEAIKRAPNGKADYRWAKETALAQQDGD